MTPEFENILFTRYPALFSERHLPMTETSMCWGICCEDGWFTLIDQLCADLQQLTDECGAPQIVAVQVKQKFGELRFYVRDKNDEQSALIDRASALSLSTCELYGASGARQLGRWSKTRCDACAACHPEG